MKQTFTKESIVQTSDMHIHLLNSKGDSIYSTNPDAVKHGVALLDRKAFVKPVDVYKLASEHFMNLNEPHDAPAYFMAGYKANPNEFTREEVDRLLIKASVIALSGKEVDTTELINSIRLLSIPASVTIENNQVIESETIWE